MDEKAKASHSGQVVPANPGHGFHLIDLYGGGTYSIQRHIVKTLGGSKGFTRDQPTGRLSSSSKWARRRRLSGPSGSRLFL